MSNQNEIPSLYIPFVFTETTDEKIKTVVEEDYDLGKVKFIDRILKEDGNGKTHYSVYIHFETFNFNERTERFLEHANDKTDPPRLYYDYGKSWFWKVMISKRVGKHMAPAVKVSYEKEEKDEYVVPPRLADWINHVDDDGVMPTLTLNPTADTFMPVAIAPCLQMAPSLQTAPCLQSAPCLQIAPFLKVVPGLPSSSWPTLPKKEKKMLPRVLWKSIQQKHQHSVKYESKLLDELERKIANDAASQTAVKMVEHMIDDFEGSSSIDSNSNIDHEFEGSSLDAIEACSIDAIEGEYESNSV